MCALSLSRTIEALEQIAPLRLAAPWDNVGLLVEPEADALVERLFLCIDLTEAVLDEALGLGATLIVAYHPPLFSGVKRLTQGEPLARSILRAIAAGVAIYSPHTALDATDGGVCDWLAEGLGELSASAPIEASINEPELGMGRCATLKSERTLAALIDALKGHLGLEHLRVALPEGQRAESMQISRVALCPGAGGDLFEGMAACDLFVTGEMRHHDVLARVAQGAAVVLTDHTNSERGFLARYREALDSRLDGACEVLISALDRDPLSEV